MRAVAACLQTGKAVALRPSCSPIRFYAGERDLLLAMADEIQAFIPIPATSEEAAPRAFASAPQQGPPESWR